MYLNYQSYDNGISEGYILIPYLCHVRMAGACDYVIQRQYMR